MLINQRLKTLFAADSAARELASLAPPKPKNKEKQPTCNNCDEENFGMCMRPPKPK